MRLGFLLIFILFPLKSHSSFESCLTLSKQQIFLKAFHFSKTKLVEYFKDSKASFERGYSPLGIDRTQRIICEDVDKSVKLLWKKDFQNCSKDYEKAVKEIREEFSGKNPNPDREIRKGASEFFDSLLPIFRGRFCDTSNMRIYFLNLVFEFYKRYVQQDKPVGCPLIYDGMFNITRELHILLQRC